MVRVYFKCTLSLRMSISTNWCYDTQLKNSKVMPVAVHVSVRVGVIETGVVFKIVCCCFFGVD